MSRWKLINRMIDWLLTCDEEPSAAHPARRPNPGRRIQLNAAEVNKSWEQLSHRLEVEMGQRWPAPWQERSRRETERRDAERESR